MPRQRGRPKNSGTDKRMLDDLIVEEYFRGRISHPELINIAQQTWHMSRATVCRRVAHWHRQLQWASRKVLKHKQKNF
jgi:hypothetical protein